MMINGRYKICNTEIPAEISNVEIPRMNRNVLVATLREV